MINPNGKVAFITGGASGIGLAMASSFAKAGMKVVIADIDETALEAAKARLSGLADTILAVRLDVAQSQSWRDAVSFVEAEFGTIDVLCNNAAIGQGKAADGRPLDMTDVPEGVWRTIMDINVTGVFLGVRTVIPLMRRKGQGGHIVNTASMAGLFAPPGLGAYSASKFAVVSMTECLRAELAPHGIDVSVICPGTVVSNFSTNTDVRLSQIVIKDYHNAKNQAIAPNHGDMMKPESVGDRVLSGILNNDFYIFTHPEYAPLVSERGNAILTSFGASAEPGQHESAQLLERFRNPAYAEALARNHSQNE